MTINAAIKKRARGRDHPPELRAKLDLEARLNSVHLEVLSGREGAVNPSKAWSPEETFPK